MHEDLPCQELVELVTDYLEGRLPPGEQRRFQAHLGQCSGCRAYLEQLRQTVRALGRLTEETLEPEAKAQLLEAFRDWKRRRGPPRARTSGERTAPGASGAAAGWRVPRRPGP